MSKDPPLDRPSQERPSRGERRPYHAPRLVRHGTVRELTQASDEGPGDLGQGPSGT
ncbi:MAG: lasso RiPP family leader peptide-containing protein [Proteobacteria bacterium]|nr:lasso RiPP family leader peptide-containing protein [Pseudomonadota bacterium]